MALPFRSSKLYLSALSKQDIGIPYLPAPSHTKYCDQCAVGKSTRNKIPKQSTSRSKNIFDLIHSDVCGPLPMLSLSKCLYFITFVDEYSRKTWIYFMFEKDQAFLKVQILRSMIEKQTRKSIKILRIDGGGEFTSGILIPTAKMLEYIASSQLPYTPFQNGIVERKNRSILEKTRSMMIGAGVPNYLWVETAKTAIYLNRSPTKTNLGITLEERFTLVKPNLRHLRTFGCLSYVHISVERKTTELESRSDQGILVGYDEFTKGYQIYFPHKRAVAVSCVVIFDKTRFYKTGLADLEFSIQSVIDSYPLQKHTSRKHDLL